jgi:hypothetical protein
MNDFLFAMVQSLLPAALEQLQKRPPAEVAAVIEQAIREYVPQPADRQRVLTIVKLVVGRLEVTP